MTPSWFSTVLNRQCARTERNFATGGGAKKLNLGTGVSLPAAVSRNRNEAHVHIQMCEEQLGFDLWVGAAELGPWPVLVLRYLLEETTTHKTRQLPDVLSFFPITN